MMLDHDNVYGGHITGHYLSTSANSKPFVGFHLLLNKKLDEVKLAEGDPEPFVELPEEMGEVHREIKLWFTPKAMQYTKKTLKLLGYFYEDEDGNFSFAELTRSNDNAHSFVDRECFVNVTHQEDEWGVRENLMFRYIERPKSDEEELDLIAGLVEQGLGKEAEPFDFNQWEEVEEVEDEEEVEEEKVEA